MSKRRVSAALVCATIAIAAFGGTASNANPIEDALEDVWTQTQPVRDAAQPVFDQVEAALIDAFTQLEAQWEAAKDQLRAAGDELEATLVPVFEQIYAALVDAFTQLEAQWGAAKDQLRAAGDELEATLVPVFEQIYAALVDAFTQLEAAWDEVRGQLPPPCVTQPLPTGGQISIGYCPGE